MDDLNNAGNGTTTAGGTGDTGTSTPGAGNSQTQPIDVGALAEEWKKRAAGWQSKFQAEQTERARLAEQLTTLQQQITGITQERDKVTTDYATLTETADQTRTEHELLQSQYERLTIVATEFPELLPLFKEGALPDASGDELRAKLKSLQALIQAKSTQDTTQQLSGATPPAPQGKRGSTAEETKNRALEALRAGDSKTYNNLMDEYWKQKDTETK